MTTYTKSPAKTLRYGDRVVFSTKNGPLVYEVQSRFLCTDTHPNWEIFARLGCPGHGQSLLQKAYGYKPLAGGWGECHDGDYAALTRAVRAIYRRIKPQSKRDAARISAAEQAIAKRRESLPQPAKTFLAYLDSQPSAFGCQRAHVVATVGATLGVDLHGL